MKVLLVEDDALSARVNAAKLTQEHIETLFAVDGEQAISTLKVESAQIGVVVLDLMLPKKNGFEVLKEIKNDPVLQKIPVIVLTDLGQDSDAKQVIAMGADEYLIKTETTIDEIVAKVKKYVGGVDENLNEGSFIPS